MIAPQLAAEIAACHLAKLPLAERRIKQLRLARLLDVRGRGLHAAPVTEAGLTNALLAVCIDHVKGSDIAATIARARSHPGNVIILPPAKFLRSATFTTATTAGDALDGLFADIRHGRLNRDLRIDVNIEASGAWIGCGVSLPTRSLDHGTCNGFFISSEKVLDVERQTNIREAVLVRLAMALGPPVVT